MRKYFAGIGSRQTTHRIALLIYRLGCAFALRDTGCFTGGAPGSDDAFEKGFRLGHQLLSTLRNDVVPIEECLRVFLPWDGFNYRQKSDPSNSTLILPDAFSIAAEHHPGWQHFANHSPIKPLMARNSHQVLGPDLLSPVRFVFCYTPDGAVSHDETSGKTGGTGQAIRLASSRGIPVYNIGNSAHLERATRFIEDVFSEFSSFLKLDMFEYTESQFRGYMPFKHRIAGNLIEASLRGEVGGIIHGANCWNQMASGIAGQVRHAFPEAFEADLATRKGDRKKLGKYSHAIVERNGYQLIVINAYTQYKYGRNDDLYADYDNIRKVCKAIRSDFPGVHFGVPRIGSGLANGSWLTTSDIVSNELGNENTTLYDIGDEGLAADPEPIPEQGALDF